MAPARGPGRRGVGGRHRLGLAHGIGWRVLALKRSQVLTHRAAGPLSVRPIDLRTLDPLEAAGVGLDHRGVHRKALAADQSRRHAAADHLLEHLAQDIALTEAPVAVHRKRRMVRDPVLQAQAAEPAVGQVQLHLLAQAPLRADRIAVADNQHPHHQLRINRRATRMAVIGPHLAAQPTQVQNSIDPPQQMTGRNHIFQIEFIEKTVLPTHRLTHHRHDPPAKTSMTRNHDCSSPSKDFFNTPG